MEEKLIYHTANRNATTYAYHNRFNPEKSRNTLIKNTPAYKSSQPSQSPPETEGSVHHNPPSSREPVGEAVNTENSSAGGRGDISAPLGVVWE